MYRARALSIDNCPPPCETPVYAPGSFRGRTAPSVNCPPPCQTQNYYPLRCRRRRPTRARRRVNWARMRRPASSPSRGPSRCRARRRAKRRTGSATACAKGPSGPAPEVPSASRPTTSLPGPDPSTAVAPVPPPAAAAAAAGPASRPASSGATPAATARSRRAAGSTVSSRWVSQRLDSLLLHGVLAQARVEVREVHAVQLLILVEAGEDELLLAGDRVHVLLQALRAHFLHHALHRRVDAARCRRAPGCR